MTRTRGPSTAVSRSRAVVGSLAVASVNVWTRITPDCRRRQGRGFLQPPRKGIVKLKPTAVLDAQHGGFTAGSARAWSRHSEALNNRDVKGARIEW